MDDRQMIEKREWKEFRDSGMLWWVNRILHLFGWALCITVEKDGTISNCYPARCKFRGFDEKSETEGFKKVTEYMLNNSEDLLKDCD